MRTGKELRDTAMAQVELGAAPSQKMVVKQAIQRCYQRFHPRTQWTTDEVHKELELAGVTLKEGRLLGPLMKRAETAGMVERVMCLLCHRQETRPSTRAKRHAGPQYVWRSTSQGYHSGTGQVVPETYDDVFWDDVDRQIKQAKEDKYFPETELGGEG